MIKGEIETFSIDALSHDGTLYYATLRVLISATTSFHTTLLTQRNIFIFNDMNEIDEEDRVYLAMKYPHLYGTNK